MEEKATVVALTGEYDASRRDELDDLLDKYGDTDPLVLDLTSVERIDTSALRSLVRFQRARREAGKKPPIFTGTSEPVRRFIGIANLGAAFNMSSDGEAGG